MKREGTIVEEAPVLPEDRAPMPQITQGRRAPHSNPSSEDFTMHIGKGRLLSLPQGPHGQEFYPLLEGTGSISQLVSAYFSGYSHSTRV